MDLNLAAKVLPAPIVVALLVLVVIVKSLGLLEKRFGGRMKRFSPRFATVGFSKDVEKKYRDRAMTIDGFQTLSTGTDGAAPAAGKGSNVGISRMGPVRVRRCDVFGLRGVQQRFTKIR